MSLDVDKYLDRRRLKRSRNWWRVVAVTTVVVALISALSEWDHIKSADHVAVVDISNIIIDDPERNEVLKEIAKNAHIRALIVRVNSPGGTMVGAESLYQVLRVIAKRKPVVAVMGELATSAGYLVSLAADHIIARQSTITGSIGVLIQSADATGLLDKLGIKPEAVKSSPLKAQPNPLEKFSPVARNAMKMLVLDMHEMFVDLVAERRKMDRIKASNLADGRIYSGRQAAKNGLVDQIGGEAVARQWLDAIKGIKRDLPAREVITKREPHRIVTLFRDLIGKTLFSERLRLDGLISLWQPSP